MLARIDGAALGTGGVVHELLGSSSSNSDAQNSGWVTVTYNVQLDAGSHTLDLGGLMTAKNSDNETADIDFDNVSVKVTPNVFGNGSFEYVASDGMSQDTGAVTVKAVEGNTITGTNADEVLIGGSGDDTLNGGSGKDYLIGGAGNDILNGGAGDDILAGGLGKDTLTGGADADTFVIDPSALTAGTQMADIITDYNNRGRR